MYPISSSLDEAFKNLTKRVIIPHYNASTAPPGLVEAMTVDPFKLSWRWGLGWIVLPVVVILLVFLIALFHFATDGIRQAARESRVKDEYFRRQSFHSAKSYDNEAPSWDTRQIHFIIACFRWIFYRPAPAIFLGKSKKPIEFPALTTLFFAFGAIVFSVLTIFIKQPLYWQSLAFGSPPIAIRSGLLAIGLVPWIIALAMKVNIISYLTGLSHERLNVFHRIAGWLCLFLSLIHTIPFYVAKMKDPIGYQTFQTYFNTNGVYIFGTGFAVLAPLAFLCLHSLPIIRNKAYEFFVIVHTPVAMVFVAMLFWHTKNALATFDFIYATIAIWLTALIARLFVLNWTFPRRLSWLIGEDASVTILPEGAGKILIPSQLKWKAGQYVYLRMPGIGIFDNHPFTITSLCSDDLPSEYGEEFRDIVLVFRPQGGFTKRLIDKALTKGPYHTYRAFLDGPYGGVKRKLASFDKVILIAGGSGVTAIISQLLDLIKRMRDQKAVTLSVHVIWAMRRPDILEWFKEELRICRDCAPPDAVQCRFFVTGAKRYEKVHDNQMTTPHLLAKNHIATYFRDTIQDTFQGIADKRGSYMSKRNSAYIAEHADGDIDLEQRLRQENEDVVANLPQAHLQNPDLLPSSASSIRNFSHPMRPGSSSSQHSQHQNRTPINQHQQENQNEVDEITPIEVQSNESIPLRKVDDSENQLHQQQSLQLQQFQPQIQQPQEQSQYEFQKPDHINPAYTYSVPGTPTSFQRNLMQYAFLPATQQSNDGWSTEYGRPNLPKMLKDLSEDLGRRNCILVCGPPSMRLEVQRAVAGMQRIVMNKKNNVDEIFLHTENYSI